jgi:putative CRISPR-associated protein (TIGR02619 family)
MKHIITIVGTSLFTNYMQPEVGRILDKKYNDISDYLERYGNYPADGLIDKKKAQEMNSPRNKIEETIKKKWLTGIERVRRDGQWEWKTANNGSSNVDASAEITSIRKIIDDLKEDIEVHLITTDTVSSVIAAGIIAGFLLEIIPGIKVYYQQGIYEGGEKAGSVIADLQVTDRDKFARDGLRRLVDKVDWLVASLGRENLAINITGGYKAVIPYLTILAQIYNLPIYYVFEDTDSLLKIPHIPVDVDWNIFNKYTDEFNILDKEGIVNSNQFNYQFITECASCLDLAGNDIALGPMGQILYKRLQSQRFVFYASDEVWKQIGEQKDIYRILEDKFRFRDTREKKTEIKGEHRVYDDGDNPNRIFYFEEDGRIYIYATFQDHEKYEEFINTKIDREKIKNSAKRRKIYLEEV